MGADCSDVRVHVGLAARSIGALAFTHGSNLYFAPGQYSPSPPQGDRLIAHAPAGWCPPVAPRPEGMDLLLLLGICEGVRIDGNVTTFLWKLDQLEGGHGTFQGAFAAPPAATCLPGRPRGRARKSTCEGCPPRSGGPRGPPTEPPPTFAPSRR